MRIGVATKRASETVDVASNEKRNVSECVDLLPNAKLGRREGV